jgi:tight adherence protein B
MNMNLWIITGLTMVAAGGIVHVFIYPHLTGDLKAEKRQAALQSSGPRRNADRQAEAANRRKQIADSIKELGEHGKRKKQSLEARIAQAGLSWSRNKFFAASIASAALFGGLVWLSGAHWLVVVPALGVGGFGFPAWVLSFCASAG